MNQDIFIRSMGQEGVIMTPETKSDFSGTEFSFKGANQSDILFIAFLNLFK